jgi:hypothetical protein
MTKFFHELFRKGACDTFVYAWRKELKNGLPKKEVDNRGVSTKP